MRFPSFTEFTVKAIAAFKRFPFTLIWAVAGSFFFINLLNADDGSLFKEYLNMLLTLILGISWFISAQFFIEQFKRPEKLWWVKFLVLVLLVFVYINLPPYDQNYGMEVPYIRYVLYLFAGHIALLCAPFIFLWHEGAYFNYLKNIMIALARSVLFSGVLYLGLVLAVVAMNFLFDIDFKEVRYLQLFVFCLGIVHTWVYLSDFPKNIQFNLTVNFNNATSVFIKFILIPLAALYILILYAYAVKIIIQWELPEGWVSYLIVALSALLFLIQFILHPFRHTHSSRLIRRFSPFCYWLLLPLLLLLYTAIYRRVADYGITENRYFLILLACFITGSAIYFLWSRKKQLRYLPIALIVLIFLASVGPWSAFSVSESSQLVQLKVLVESFPKGMSEKKNQNQNKADTAIITYEQAYRLRSITRYLYDHGKLSETEAFLGYDPILIFKLKNGYGIGDSIIKKMNIKVLDSYNSNSDYFDYYANQKDAINIEGYDVLKDIYLNSNENKPIQLYNSYGLSYRLSSQKFIIEKKGNGQIEIPLNTLIKNIESNQIDNYTAIKDGDMRITSENKSLKASLIFKSVSFKRSKNNPELENCQFFVLFKIKDHAE